MFFLFPPFKFFEALLFAPINLFLSIHWTGGHFGLFMDSNHECLNILLSNFSSSQLAILYFSLEILWVDLIPTKWNFG